MGGGVVQETKTTNTKRSTGVEQAKLGLYGALSSVILAHRLCGRIRGEKELRFLVIG